MYFSNRSLARQFPMSEAKMPKVNENIGMEDPLDAAAWRLQVIGGAADDIQLTLENLQALPQVEMITELRCIEGWSCVVHWTGCRLRDFVAKYPPKNRKVDVEKLETLPPYLGLETPDGEYYVGLDMASALHPQTLLCWAMMGEPLTPDHGAPLRLVIPVKYGIKNIKRIGKLIYTDRRPRDYWAENDEGYDWYAGLKSLSDITQRRKVRKGRNGVWRSPRMIAGAVQSVQITRIIHEARFAAGSSSPLRGSPA